jgi:hypothetical protein
LGGEKLKVINSEGLIDEKDLGTFEKLSKEDKQKVLDFIIENIDSTYSQYQHYKSLAFFDSDQTLNLKDGEFVEDYDGGFQSFYCNVCEDIIATDLKGLIIHIMTEHLGMNP